MSLGLVPISGAPLSALAAEQSAAATQYVSAYGKSFPNEYAEVVTLSSTGYDVGFGFNAAVTRISNIGSNVAYYSLRSTTGAAVTDHRLSTGESVQLDRLRMAGCSFAATSSGAILNIGAWG